MSKTFVNRITLVSVLSGALLAVHLVLPVHAGHTRVTANQQFGAGSFISDLGQGDILSAQTIIR